MAHTDIFFKELEAIRVLKQQVTELESELRSARGQVRKACRDAGWKHLEYNYTSGELRPIILEYWVHPDYDVEDLKLDIAYGGARVPMGCSVII